MDSNSQLMNAVTAIDNGLDLLSYRIEGNQSSDRLLDVVYTIRLFNDKIADYAHPIRPASGNHIFSIMPYRYQGQWVFDYPEKGIFKEALVAGIPEMIEMATSAAGIDDPEYGFLTRFSKGPFKTEGFSMCLNWEREEEGGNVYSWPEANYEGWLCPVLLDFFDYPPRQLYVDVLPAQAV